MTAALYVTEHFAVDEFKCRDGTPYPISQVDEFDSQRRTWLITRLQPLCETLEVIRAAAGGRPLRIDSGYRTLAYDQKLYDADKGQGNVATPQGSQHPKGRAADIVHPVLLPQAVKYLILDLRLHGKLPHLGGLGLYASFVHVDVRPQVPVGHLAQWSGTRSSNLAR